MKNKEKYANELMELIIKDYSLAYDKRTREVKDCDEVKCNDCQFYEEEKCHRERLCRTWLDAEYVEPSVDWRGVPVDTPILYKTLNHTKSWLRGYFAKYEDGKVYVWAYGRTSWSDDGEDNCNACEWATLLTDKEVPETEKQWHNLKDYRPEDRQDVLTWDGLDIEFDRWSDDAEYFEYTDADEIWWMELPKPPGGGQK